MANNRMLSDIITLYNYIGERDMVAQYAVTILYNVFCDTNFGASATMQGKTPQDAARLYVFDSKVCAASIGGSKKQFLPFEEWNELEDKSDFWTFNENEKDFFVLGFSNCENPKENAKPTYAISKAHYFKKGTSRMWHWEIDGL